jgi:hypothetical protein
MCNFVTETLQIVYFQNTEVYLSVPGLVAQLV